MDNKDQQIRSSSKDTPKSFEKLYDEMYHSLCLYGYKILPERDVVDDAVQEAFIVYWGKRNSLETFTSVKAFLYTVVRYKILTQIRNKHTISIENFSQSNFESEVQITKEETYKSLRKAIEFLPEQTKKIINLTMSGYSNQEMADTLDISINTVKTLKKKGYSKLRLRLKDNIFALLLLAEMIN